MARGKQVYKIDWEHEGLKIQVPVRLFKEKPSYSNDYKEQHIFRAEYKPANINEKDTDSDKLRDRVIKLLETWHSIDWRLVIVIKVTQHESERYDSGYDVRLAWNYYAIGTHGNGAEVHMRVPEPDKLFADGHWDGNRFSDEPTEGLPEEGYIKPDKGPFYSNRQPYTQAMVSATPANKAALGNFVKAMEALVEKMHHHFHPCRINALLQSPGLILPAPAKKEKKSGKARS